MTKMPTSKLIKMNMAYECRKKIPVKTGFKFQRGSMETISPEKIEIARHSVASRNNPLTFSKNSAYTGWSTNDNKKHHHENSRKMLKSSQASLARSYSRKLIKNSTISIINETLEDFNPHRSLVDWKKQTINPNKTLTSWNLQQ